MSLKLRSRVNFPATVTATGGIKVIKESGIWTISPDFAGLTSIAGTDVSDPTSKQVWLFDPIANSYAVLTLAGLGDALFKLTSTTSVTIGTGSKSFTTQSNKDVAAGQFVLIVSDASPTTNYMLGQITSYSGGTLVVNVTTTAGSGAHTDWTIRVSGNTGATGDKAGFKYTYNTATSGDPGSGKFLFNNATFGSATAFNISETDGESINLASVLATLDDGTSTNKCLVLWVNADGSKGFAGYITGTLTDNGAYDTFSFTPVTSWGSPANNDIFRMQPLRVGDKGADGAIAGSTGAVDRRVLIANGTGGATLQASAVAIDASGNVTGTGTVDIGNADTTLSRASAGVIAVEGVNLTPNIPITSKSAAYTTVLADANTAIYHPSSDNNARTFTIDSNANVAYPVGTCLTFFNDINTVTIAITSDTLVWAGTGSTGSRTLAANGMATATKLASTRWMISGAGLS